VKNDARYILEGLDEITAIQRELMTVRAPIRFGMIVKMIFKVVFGGRAEAA